MSIYRMRTEFGHHLKWLMGVLAFIFIVGAIWSFSSMPRANGPGGRQGGDIIATVNGMEISKNEMEVAFAEAVKQMQDQGVRSTLQFAFRRASVFQSLVDSRMQLAAANAMGVSISEKDVQAKRDEMITQFLKKNRTMVLGKLSKEEEAVDPRQDSKYTDELKRNGMSVRQVEDEANQYVPEAQIRVMVAQEGLQKAMKEKAGTVTDKDIANSYNLYKVRQIVVPKVGMPKDQVTNQVNKIAAEAQKGGDFEKLAEQYSKDPSKGREVDVPFGKLSPEVWDKLTAMKPGEVSNPIETDQAVYVVKLDAVVPQLPAKLSKKDKDSRKQYIEFMRQYTVMAAVQKQVKEKTAVKVSDPEMAGYWHLSLAQQAGPNQAEAKKQMSLAAAAFKKAMVGGSSGNYATAMLAIILREQGQKAEATKLLYQLLEGKDSTAQGSDLRIMLGDLLAEDNKKDEAVKQYEAASETAVNDPNTHQQLIMKFQQLKRPDLVAKEQATITEYNARKKAWEAQQKNAGGAPGTPSPTAPKPGG